MVWLYPTYQGIDQEFWRKFGTLTVIGPAKESVSLGILWRTTTTAMLSPPSQLPTPIRVKMMHGVQSIATWNGGKSKISHVSVAEHIQPHVPQLSRHEVIPILELLWRHIAIHIYIYAYMSSQEFSDPSATTVNCEWCISVTYLYFINTVELWGEGESLLYLSVHVHGWLTFQRWNRDSNHQYFHSLMVFWSLLAGILLSRRRSWIYTSTTMLQVSIV